MLTLQAMPPSVAQPHVQARLYDAGCELEQLADLLSSIGEKLDGAFDPHGITAAPASLARIGMDAVDGTLRRLVDAEGACATCWKGRLAIAAALGTVPHMGD